MQVEMKITSVTQSEHPRNGAETRVSFVIPQPGPELDKNGGVVQRPVKPVPRGSAMLFISDLDHAKQFQMGDEFEITIRKKRKD